MISPQITGHDLQKLGLPPGPIYRQILGAILDGWLDGKIENSEQERSFLDGLIKNEPSIHPAS
jgi:hypothetical protein